VELEAGRAIDGRQENVVAAKLADSPLRIPKDLGCKVIFEVEFEVEFNLF
jgi:hypothetical protein